MRNFIYDLTLLTCLLTVAALSAQQVAAQKPCPIAFKCSSVEDLAWATDGRKCYVFVNDCQLKNENCQRQNRYEKVLRKVSKTECQALCSSICTDEYEPVCGFYKEQKRTFPNNCMLTNHVCNTGETYVSFGPGACEE